MDKVVLCDRQYNSDISYEREPEKDPLQIDEQQLEVNYSIHFLVKEECLNIQDSPQLETNTCALIKQETLDECTNSHFNSSVKRESLDKCTDSSVNNCTCLNSKSIYNSAGVDCTTDSKVGVILNAGLENFECHSDEANMGIAKSRRTSLQPIDIVDTNLEYNPSTMIKPSLSPTTLNSDDNADNVVKYSFTPAKSVRFDDTVYSVDVTNDWESSVGDLLTPIRSKISSVDDRTVAKKLKLSGVKKKDRPPIVSSKIASVKKRGRPSKGKLIAKNKPKSSARKSKDNTTKKIASGGVKSERKVLEASEKKPKVLVKREATLISPKGKGKVETMLKRKVSKSRPKILADRKPVLGQDLVCRWCGRQFTTLQALSRHTLQHSEARTFYCSRCTFSCQYLWQLHSHRSVAHPEMITPGANRTGRTYRCQACQYTCQMISMLKRHMLIHLQSRQYACKVCPFTCNVKYNLKLHMLRHSRVKNHKCNVCGMRFNRSFALTLHSRVHTGEKPYSCENCNFTCAHFSSLRRHRLQHANNSERLCCPTCDFACKLLVTFLKHRATEHDERGLYSCHLCHARLDNTRQLAKHLTQHRREGKYGDNAELFRLPKYLVRIRDKKTIKKVETEQKVPQSVLKATRKILKDSSNTSIGKLIVKNLAKNDKAIKKAGKPAKAGKTVTKSSPKSIKKIIKYEIPEFVDVPMEYDVMQDVAEVPLSLPEVKVVCRRLTISEIIRRRVDNKS